jgi:hypothetical protein
MLQLPLTHVPGLVHDEQPVEHAAHIAVELKTAYPLSQGPTHVPAEVQEGATVALQN